ncbi:MAG: hypothetical protein ACRCXZ_02325 [Patescibacteria group bacterium]
MANGNHQWNEGHVPSRSEQEGRQNKKPDAHHIAGLVLGALTRQEKKVRDAQALAQAKLKQLGNKIPQPEKPTPQTAIEAIDPIQKVKNLKSGALEKAHNVIDTTSKAIDEVAEHGTIEGISKDIKATGKAIQKGAKAVVEARRAGKLDLKKNLKTAYDTVKSTSDKVKADVTNAYEKGKKAHNDTFEEVKTKTSNVAKGAKDLVKKASEQVIQRIEDTEQGAQSTIDQNLTTSAMKSRAKEAASATASQASELEKRSYDPIIEVIENPLQPFQNAKTTVKSRLQAAQDKIKRGVDKSKKALDERVELPPEAMLPALKDETTEEIKTLTKTPKKDGKTLRRVTDIIEQGVAKKHQNRVNQMVIDDMSSRGVGESVMTQMKLEAQKIEKSLLRKVKGAIEKGINNKRPETEKDIDIKE